MFYALNLSGLWEFVSGAYPRLFRSDRAAAPLKTEETRILEEKESDWYRRNAKAGKISSMFYDLLQMNPNRSINSHHTHEELKKKCRSTRWNNKWELLPRIELTHLSKCKNMIDFPPIYKFEEAVEKMRITIEKYFTIKTLNSLSSQYETFVTL